MRSSSDSPEPLLQKDKATKALEVFGGYIHTYKFVKPWPMV